MRPTSDFTEQHQDYQRIEKAIRYLCEHRLTQPSLTQLADHLHLSEAHLQRIFTRWAGVSPKRFLQYLTKEHAKKLLRTHTVSETALAAGLSGSSRLHDLMLSYESVTPGEYQQQGQQLLIEWGIHASPFGKCFIAVTQRGICFLAFFESEQEFAQIEADFHAEWGQARIKHNDAAVRHWVQAIFKFDSDPKQPLHLILKGSAFQLKVWEALIRIPSGTLYSYAEVAQAVAKPTAVRAVASAIARNNIGYLIPCHRVIRSTGEVNQYRWGSPRKQALLAWEAAQTDADGQVEFISSGIV